MINRHKFSPSSFLLLLCVFNTFLRLGFIQFPCAVH